MQEYVSATLALAAVSLLSLLLFPDAQEKTKKTFELALAILALAILARPLAELRLPTLSSEAWQTPALEELIGDAQSATLAELEAAVAEGVEADICAKFSLPEGAVRATLSLSLDAGELKIQALSLALAPSAALADPVRIRDYAKKTYTENCEVTSHA